MLIQPTELLKRIEAGSPPAILDVRSSLEFAQGRVPGAINRPFWAVFLGLARIPFKIDERIVVYCQHGPRAHIAGQGLLRRGFKHVTYLEGHMSRWHREGLREETGD